MNVLQFDDSINQCFQKTKEFLEQKKKVLYDIGQDQFDLIKANFNLHKLFNLRQEIYKSLFLLIRKQIYNPQLTLLIEIYENYLSAESELSLLLDRLNKKYIIDHKFKVFNIDEKKCYAFINLSENRGQVIKVSNNFDQIVIHSSNQEVIGKNINFMQHISIAKVHDAILNNYLTKFKSQNSSMHLNPIIGVDKDQWAIPYQIRFQTFQLETYNFGVCAQINLIEDQNQYILIDQTRNYEIITVSYSFYKQILEQSLTKSSLNHTNISQIIPCLQDIYLNIKESKFFFLQNVQSSQFLNIDQTQKKNINYENFTTVMIKPLNKDQLDYMKNPKFDDMNDSIFLELEIYAIRGEMYSIENQFLNLIQLKIFEIIQIQEIQEKMDQLQNVYQILKQRKIQKSTFPNIVTSLEQIHPQQSKQIFSDNIQSSARDLNNNNFSDQFRRQPLEMSDSSDDLPLQKEQNTKTEAQNTIDSKQQIFSPLNKFKMNQGEDYLNENNLEFTRTQIISPQNSFIALTSRQIFQLNSTEREISISSKNQIEQLQLLNKKRISKPKSNFQSEFNTFNSLKQKSLTLNHYIENHKFGKHQQQAKDQTNLIKHFTKNKQTKKLSIKVAGSLQSSKSSSSQRKNILSKINQNDKFLGLILFRVLGVLGLLSFLVVTLIYFLTLNNQLHNQKEDYQNINWGSYFQSLVTEIITDSIFQSTLNLPFFNIPPQQQVILNEDIQQQLNNNYNTTRDLIIKYVNSDKSTTQLYNIVLNTEIDYTFLISKTSRQIVKLNLGYALEMFYALSYYVVYDLDIDQINLLQMGNNLIVISKALLNFKTQTYDQVQKTFESNQFLITIQFIAIMIASFIFALSLLLIYQNIQFKRQVILNLFATLSPQSIVCMITDIVDCQSLLEKCSLQNDQKKNSSFKHLNTNQKSQHQFEHNIQVQKRKNISITNKLPQFSFKVALLSLLFFILSQFGSITNFIVVHKFTQEEKVNREFLTELMLVYEFTISTSSLRIPIVVFKIQDQLLQSYIDFIQEYMDKSQSILQKMYDLVNTIHDDNRFQRQSFNTFVIQAFQNNTCQFIQQNLNPEKNKQFNIEYCNSIANGIFKQGLVQVVKFSIDLYVQRQPEILNSDLLSLFPTLFQQQQDLSELDQFYLRVYFEYAVQIIEQRIAEMTFDHYDYMVKINYIIFFLSIVSFIILIYISFFKFFEFSFNQIRQTKHLLNLLDIKTIEENQYILTYLKIQK